MGDKNETSTTSGHPHSSEHLRIKLDQHMKQLCTLAIVQQLLNLYGRVKRSSENVDHAFTTVENGVEVAFDRSLDLYDQYCQRHVESVNGQLTHVMETVATFAVGGIVIVVQLTLTIFIAIVNLIFSAVISGRETLQNVSTSAANAQTAAKQMVSSISDKVQDVSRASTEKVGQQANRLLDHANRVAGSTLGVAPETGGTDKTLAERLRDLGYRITENLKDRAHGDVVNTVYADMHGIMERLSNSLSLVEMVREQKSWAVEKFGSLQISLADLKASLEKEAERLKENPEEALMDYLRQNSTLLSAQINTLKESSGQLLNEPAKKKLDAVASYLEELDRNLGEAHDVHEVKDEVFAGARERLTDLVQWTTNRLAEQQKHKEGKNEHSEHEHGDSTTAGDIKLNEAGN